MIQPRALLSFSAIGVIAAGGIAWVALAGPMRAAAPTRAARSGPVVVELFQSQGCSSCPPAQDNLNAIADRPDVLALSYGVTYWDYLGWKDSFASPQFTQRQWDYAHRNGRRQVATPEIWINGQTSIIGSDRHQLDSAITAAGASQAPALAINGGRLSVGTGRAPADGADIWLVRYDPRTVQVAIRAGENGGRTLPHRDIVRELTRIGHWTGTAQSIALPVDHGTGLRTAVLLQAGAGGAILAAAKG